MDPKELAAHAQELAHGAGKICLEYRARGERLQVDYKNERDLVTEADRAVEQYLRAGIARRYPDHGVYGEEQGDDFRGGDVRWVIDPIDGTSSYVHGQPFFSVSIGIELRGETVAGVVYAPVLEEIFVATLGGGSTCNGRSIQVSRRDKLISSMLSSGFACVRAGMKHNNIPYFTALMPKLRDLRRYGSAAIDLSYVACGRLEGFWELGLHLYDVCAGMLLVREAGGRVSDFSGSEAGMVGELFASNGRIHDATVEVLKSVKALQQL